LQRIECPLNYGDVTRESILTLGEFQLTANAEVLVLGKDPYPM
jgi:hypothetical protein